MTERHERIEDWCLAGFDQGRRKQARSCAGGEVKEMNSNRDAEMLIAFVFEGSVGQMSKREISAGQIGFVEPALVG